MSSEEVDKIVNSEIEITIQNLISRRDEILSQIHLLHGVEANIESVQEPVMVSLGDGYFVEKTKKQAKEYLQRRIATYNQSLSDLEGRITEAKRTLKNLVSYQELVASQNNDNDSEGPIMDIVEELDEDGNVINVKVNNEVYDPEPPASLDQKVSDDISDTQEHKSKDKTKESQIMQITEELDENGNFLNGTVHNDHFDRATEQQLSKQESTPDSDDDQIKELMEDMELVARNPSQKFDQKGLLAQIDNLKVLPEDKEKLKSICNDEFKTLEDDSDDDTSTANFTSELSENSLDEDKGKQREDFIASIIKENELNDTEDGQNTSGDLDSLENKQDFSSSTPSQLAIDKDDILELELLADDFDDSAEDNEPLGETEEWDFEFSDEDDDDDDDYADLMLYGSGASYGNAASDKILWEKVIELRKKNANIDEMQLNGEKSNARIIEAGSQLENQNSRNESQPSGKKTVRFSEKLDIKEIEDISEFTKNMDYGPKVSLFKQRSGNYVEKSSLIHPGPKLSDSTAVKVIPSNSMPLTDEPLEREKIITDLIQNNEGKKISRFKTGIMEARKTLDNKGDFSNNQVDKPSENAGNVDDIIHSDIVEKGIETVSDATGPAVVNNSSNTAESDKNRTLSNDSSQPPKKLSRFKAQTQGLKKSSTGQMKPPSPENQSTTNDIIEKFDTSQHEATDLIPESKVTTYEKQDEETLNQVKDQTSSKIEEDEEKHLATTTQNTTNEFKEATFDFQSAQEDMDTMAKAYVLGLYDEDIATHGPVVNELSDFEVLNKMLTSMPEKSTTIKETSTPQTEDHVDEILPAEEYGDDSDDENGPIMTDDIIENDLTYDDTDLENIEDEIYDSVLRQDVVNDYHKLRQKVIYKNNETGFRKSEKEMEFEPIDENGNTIKMSRFKAARMAHLK